MHFSLHQEAQQAVYRWVEDSVVVVLNIHMAAAGVGFSRVLCFNPDLTYPVDSSRLGAKADTESAAQSGSLRLPLSDSTLKIYLTGLRRNR